MPNWCSNYLQVSGSEVKEIIKKIKESDIKEGCLFSSTVGVVPEQDGITQWGTKWDVPLRDIEDQLLFIYDDEVIGLSFETAWSPPIEYCIKLNSQYGVNVEITYGEPGCDFYGRFTIDKNGNKTENDYEYYQGMYILNNDDFWENMDDTINSYIDYSEENSSFDDLISTYFSFEELTDDDKKSIKETYEEILLENKEGIE